VVEIVILEFDVALISRTKLNHCRWTQILDHLGKALLEPIVP
jgi:hypothetical protein